MASRRIWLPGEYGYPSSCTIEDTYINPLTHRVYWFLQEYEGGYVKFGLLRSVDWLYNLSIEKVGDTATFAMEEFGVVGDAQLMQIDRCPEIEMGAGRICTGWFEHSAGQLWELYIEGSSTPIRGTDRHPIWSNDRLAWIALSELKEGESVQVQGGYSKVQHLQATEDVEKVYTLEIDADHCYRVGQQGLLVHNASCPWYHGTDSTSAANIIAHGLNSTDFLAAKPDDPRGLFVESDSSVAGDYARLRTFDRNRALPKGAAKLTAIILVADHKDIGLFLQPVPGGIGGEMLIPVADFPLVPKDAFKLSGIAP